MNKAVVVEHRATVDDRDCAFPRAVQLTDGTLLCSYGVGGGPEVRGGTDWSRSTDGGRIWDRQGTILPGRHEDGATVANALKLSLAPDGTTLYAYGSRYWRYGSARFGRGRDEAVLCISRDSGATWSAAQVLPFGVSHPLEVSDGILPLPDGGLLAPGGLLPGEDRLGEKVVGLISTDGGCTWPVMTTIFEHPEHEHGYFEHKFIRLANGHILAVCWTVSLDRELVDQPNHYTLSRDGGRTWTVPRSSGLRGQTMCPLAIDADRLLVAYNRRYGRQGIVVALVRFGGNEGWDVLAESLVYDAAATLVQGEAGSGVETFDAFKFGFPTLRRLQDDAVLLTYWVQPPGAARFAIHAVRLRLADGSDQGLRI